MQTASGKYCTKQEQKSLIKTPKFEIITNREKKEKLPVKPKRDKERKTNFQKIILQRKGKREIKRKAQST